ncbi:phenylacetyl-CoA ligase [Roridomyces roridus]|uniref:Phenylacetyl-CoA ligase n=1 Tax=Roridomyces roridus TaxID=1738132 RepID=A0AAD7AYP8_9AGAR|nr:phenylacetyl-CoA ligase [Roridomyces roridus]
MPDSLVPPPDNLSVAQFLLDGLGNHVTRAQRSASTPCLIDDDSGQRVYLEELRTRAGKIATAMNFYWKLGHGEIVTIISPNHIDYGPCAWATHRLGGIVATLGPMLTADEITHQLRIARPSIIFVHSECLASVLPAAGLVGLHPSRIILIDGIGSSSPGPHGLKNLDALIQGADSLPRFNERILAAGEAKNTIAFLAPSSGTTGTQKAVMISHYNVISIVIQMATSSRLNEPYAPLEERRFRPGDICYGFLPLFHIYGLLCNLHFMLYAGLTLVLTPKFNFEKFLASIEKYRITHLTLVPPQVVLLCKEPIVKNYDLSSIRMCLVAAAPLSASLTQELLQILPNIHLGQGYGLTETCGATSIFPLSQKIGTLGSAGQLLPGTLAKVVKPDGTLATETETGELYIKGGQVALGYYGNEEATRETFIDGWLKTGDQVYFKDGDIFVVERLKELIKVKGFQVPPAELEGHLLIHPKIADAAVIGVPDDYSGELPMAFIVLKPEVAAPLKGKRDGRLEKQLREDIFKHVASAKSKHKWLTGGIQFISAIPRNPSGKILRRLLRDQISQDTKGIHARL